MMPMMRDLTVCRWYGGYGGRGHCDRLGWIGTLEGKWEYAYCDEHVDAFQRAYPEATVRPNPDVPPVDPDQMLAAWRRRYVGR